MSLSTTETAEILMRSTTEWLPIDQIAVDRSYQRQPSSSKIGLIAKRFNLYAAGFPVVSLREDGQLILVDGQHRLEAMKKLGIASVECAVIRGLTVQQEAEVYTYCNTVRKAPAALDVFRARLVAGDSTAIAIQSAVEKCDLSIQFQSGRRLPNSIWAVTALEDIYKRGREALLEKVLFLATRSWPDDINALEAKVLLGIAWFHLKYQGRYTREEFVAKMNRVSLNSLFAKARYHAENGGHAGTAFSKALQEVYDSGKRARRLETK